MDSGFQQQQYQHHFQDLQKQFQHQKQQTNSLTRFRSAPSSYFASFLDAADTVTNSGGGANGGDRGDISNTKGDFFNPRPLSPETENILSHFVSSMDDGDNSLSQNLCEIPENSQMGPQFTAKVKQEGDYNTSSPMIYHSTSKPPLANQHSSASAANSVRMHSKPHMKIGIGGRDINTTSSLTRHSSSPAGFFDNLNIDGYGVISGMGNYGSGNPSNDQVNYSSGQPSTTPGLIRQNSQVEEKIMRMNSLEETNFSNPISSWADSILSETIPSLDGDGDKKIFSDQNLSENQTGESRGRVSELARRLSLPSTSAELSAMEKLLYLQDAVPLRIRAKRGFATHPRSIAERVRRTKISERMRKLQDLVPNMDKQTNTADMLELAVDYIKDLRKQVKTLHGNQAKCTCPR